MDFAVLSETIMVFCFGISWPLSIYKSWTSRTAQGRSLMFEVALWIGYAFGIIGKILTQTYNLATIFYVINIVMVTVDILLYFRNKALDKKAGRI